MVRILLAACVLLYTLYYLLNHSTNNDDVNIQDRAKHETEKVQEILDQRKDELNNKLNQSLQ